MNVKDYISSGIIESYVLGLADDAERAEFEMMYDAHEEVRTATRAFETTLESGVMAQSVAPPPGVKAKLFNSIGLQLPSVDRLSGSSGIAQESQAQVIPEAPRTVIIPWTKYLAAASVILLVGSALLNFYLFRQYKEYSERYSALLASQTELAANNSALQTSVETYKTSLDLIRNPNMAVIKMAASQVPGKSSPDSSGMATVFWNKQTTEVFIMVNKLPVPATGKQYQLWAIVGGKPVSAGVFNMSPNAIMQAMSKIPNAQAFAVTLEKEGGVPAPEGAMYVLGTT